MLKRILLVMLLCVQTIVIAQESKTTPVPPVNSHRDPADPVPAKTKDCTPEEEKWWNSVKDEGKQIVAIADQMRRFEQDSFRWPHRLDQTYINEVQEKIQRYEAQIETEHRKFAGLLQSAKENDYKAPVEDSKLVPVYYPRPNYTEEARRNKVVGTVIAEATFPADGTVSDVTIIKGLGFGLDEKAVEAVKKMVFVPAVKDGVFILASRQKIRVSFTLV
ncbi:MAG TPA: energy transducer TonB [Blastocatellia bacterium]|nr:energy transducer TonB [Blastocatellia bacterium]